MNRDKAKRDGEIERLRREMADLERRIKLDEAVPQVLRQQVAGLNLNDKLLGELSAYSPRDCEHYGRLRKQLRRLYV